MSGKTKRKGKREKGNKKREKEKGKKEREKGGEKTEGARGGGLKYGVCVACGAHAIPPLRENYGYVFV